MKPDHFRENDNCVDCKHYKMTYHHCSSCSENDEYTCMKHNFLVTEYGYDYAQSHVCDDFEKENP